MSIASSAVLVELNISVWPASKVDKEITEQVNHDAGAVHGAAQTKKNLFAGTSMRKDIEKFAARVRLFHNQHTLPWADKGERLLPTALFMDYKQTMDNYAQTFAIMCDNFFTAYPTLVQQAQSNLGSMYKADDYPDIDVVREKFGFRRAVNPLPEAGDFRLDVNIADLEEIKQEYSRKFDERLAEAMRAPWERLHKILQDTSSKLTDEVDSNGEVSKKRYHETLITNAQELCDLLTKLNVTKDPKLEQARRELETTMLGADIESIKESAEVRNDLKHRVDDILKRFDW
jgi:hypothetical protein